MPKNQFADDDILDFDFPNLNDSFLDLFGGDIPILIERWSEKVKNQVNQMQQTTDAFNEKLRKKTDEFIQEQLELYKRKMKQKSVVLLRDKIAFVFGVMYVICTTFVFAGYPHWLPVYYVAVTLPMLTYRYFRYRAQKWHYFMADLCYFVNALLVLSTFFFPFSTTLWTVGFVLANGPVAWAIYMWRNSLVFHSVDKIISVVIHIMPPLITYTIRWFPVPANATSYLHRFPKFNYQSPTAVPWTWISPIIYGMIFYTIWQAGYHYFIIVRRSKNVYGGSHATSFTYLVNDYLNKRSNDPLTKMMVRTPEKYRVYLFEAFNFIYAVLTVLPTPFLYRSFMLHTTFILFLVVIMVFNGANFYLEVFSRKYAAELADLENSPPVSKKIPKEPTCVPFDATVNIKSRTSTENIPGINSSASSETNKNK